MEEYYKILELASDGKLPEEIDETFEFPINFVTELIHEGYLTAIDATDSEGIACLETKITFSGRKYLDKLKTQSKEGPDKMAENKIRLFISHNSSDSDFVQKLVDLLQFALPLSSEQIRCTSIDGYRLPGGANIPQQLKQEVREADSFIGVISPASIKALYVIFELGARWGAGLSLIPLMTPGTDPDCLTSPLAEINALRSENRSEIQQLITNLASELKIKPEPPESYNRYITAILNTKK